MDTTAGTPRAPGGAARSVSVVVPSYRRPRQVLLCLAGLRAQTRPPDEIVIAVRDTDLATREVLAQRDDVTVVVVHEPGVLAAMNAGVAASRGDIIAFTDDDAVPRRHWLARLLPHYDDPAIGGAGGRDVLHPLPQADERPATSVGRISPLGRLISSHHLGIGPAEDVDVLKGVNMSFRREALALPRALRGDGAQAHWEVATSLWAADRGWRIVYDPGAIVDHFLGPRFDDDQRDHPAGRAVRSQAFNLVATLLSFRRDLLWRRALFGLAVGDGGCPGVARAVVALVRGEDDVVPRLWPSLAGQLAALGVVIRGGTVDMVVASPSPARRQPATSPAADEAETTAGTPAVILQARPIAMAAVTQAASVVAAAFARRPS